MARLTRKEKLALSVEGRVHLVIDKRIGLNTEEITKLVDKFKILTELQKVRFKTIIR